MWFSSKWENAIIVCSCSVFEENNTIVLFGFDTHFYDFDVLCNSIIPLDDLPG